MSLFEQRKPTPTLHSGNCGDAYSKNAMTIASAPPRPRLELTDTEVAAPVALALPLVADAAVPEVPVAVAAEPAFAAVVGDEPELPEVLELPELPELLPELLPEFVVLFEAAPPDWPEMALPGRLTVDSLARAWKLASERVALAATFSLITMVMPFWQCLPCEQ